LVEILVEIGKKDLDFILNEVFLELLKQKSPYTDSQKTICLQALSHLAKQFESASADYGFSLGPLLTL
jgi:hypothetical protein